LTAGPQPGPGAEAWKHHWPLAWPCWSGCVWRFPWTRSCRRGWCQLQAELPCRASPGNK